MPSAQNQEGIREFLKNLAAQDWVRRSERRWWPNFAFHYTDIRNAQRILEDGKLYSRLQVERLGKLVVSSGSPDILAGTSLDVRDCVRLYFRPQTPTQFHAEGVHSKQSLAKSRFPHAHCPTPVFFLFDAPAVLSLPNSHFSDRGLGGSDYHLGTTLSDLKALPWKRIYHQGWIDWSEPDRAHAIVACRNAEMIVPQKLDLQFLRFIYCRSEAEKDTLLHLLSPNLRQKFRAEIFASNRSELFFRRRTFIESATLLADGFQLRFSPDTECPGPFRLRIEITTTQTMIQENEDFTLGPSYEYVATFRQPIHRYKIQVTLDDHLVYANRFVEITLPF